MFSPSLLFTIVHIAEIGNDSVVSALEAIVDKFGNELVPHASVLVQKLCESFQTYASAGDDDDEASMAACQCMDTVCCVNDTMLDAMCLTMRIADSYDVFCVAYLDSNCVKTKNVALYFCFCHAMPGHISALLHCTLS